MRGMRNVRSSASRGTRAGRSQEPQDHQLFMQVTVLEMEKSRRLVERRAALERVAEIDERLADVEQDKQRLLERLAESAASADLGHFLPGPANTMAHSLARLRRGLGSELSAEDKATAGPDSESSPQGLRIRY
jgi:hypothetical protein